MVTGTCLKARKICLKIKISMASTLASDLGMKQNQGKLIYADYGNVVVKAITVFA